MHQRPIWQWVFAALLFLFALTQLAPLYRSFATRETKGEDIYYLWVEGQRILNGENPYARVLASNMRDNDKYATYFPVFYWLSAASQALGLRDYDAWINFWRVIFNAFHIAIGALIFLILQRERLGWLGAFGALFWWFNRWTLEVVRIADIEFVPIFFLVLSLWLVRRRLFLALFLFGLSLGLKQLAIFMTPIYLIWAWQSTDHAQWRRVFAAAAIIASVTLVASLPFLLWNAEGFIKSVVFSATRNPAGHLGVPSFDEWIGWVGIPAKLPLLALLGFVYVGVWQRRVKTYASALLTMCVFLDFNSVLFRQYICWALPFLPLVLSDLNQQKSFIEAS